MELDKRKIYYVYEWYNVDTGEIFYVGKGRGNRCRDRAPADRNKLFIKYITDNRNCTYRKIYEGLDEDTACNLEDKRIKELKELGFCSCNLIDRTTHRGVLYGKDNGFYGKTHSEESIRKMREANLDGHNAGMNNSQYGISPQERMSPEVYERWLYKQQHNKDGDKNGRATPIVVYNDNERYEFSCILYCCDFLREKFGISLNDDSMICRISECIRCNLKYQGYYFDTLSENKNYIKKTKFSIFIRLNIVEQLKKQFNGINLSKLISDLIFYYNNNVIEVPKYFKQPKGKQKTIRLEKSLYEKFYNKIKELNCCKSWIINCLLDKYCKGEINIES